MKKLIKNNKGFSLVEVLVAAAIMGGLSLLLMRFMELENKMNKTAMVNNSLSQITGLVSSILSNKTLCKGNLMTVPPGTEFDMNNPSDGFIIDAGLESVTSILTLGQSFGSTGIIFSKAELKFVEAQVAGSPTPAELVLTFNKDSGSKRTTLGGEQVSRSFYIIGHFCDTTYHTPVLTGDPEASAQAYCESSHGASSYVGDVKSYGGDSYLINCYHSCSPTKPLSSCE